MTRAIQVWKRRARQLKTEAYVLYLAYKDPRTPWYAKVLAACVVGYAFSPIDLIPDPIPIIGYLDDLVLIPMGIAIALKMIPPLVLAEARAKAQLQIGQAGPTPWVAAVIIVAIWLVLVVVTIVLVARGIRR